MMISSVMRKSAPLLMVMLLGFLVSLPWASVANELTVTKIGQWGGGYYDDVAVAGNYAYAATGRGLAIVDISTPTAPTLAGSYDTSDYARGVAVDGNYAYVADGSSGLQIIDITTPTAPTLAGSYDTPNSASGVAVDGNYAYVADWHSGLQIIDITTPTAPTLAGSYDTPDYALGVAVDGNYAYVADSWQGLQIIDITTPTAPTLAGSYDTPDYARSVAVDGNYAYVADGSSGLQIIDITTPTAPTLAGSYDTPNSASGVAVDGNYAYVADWHSGLQIIDITTPTAPTLAGSYDTPDYALGVAVDGNYAYVADLYSGLQIIDITTPTAPTLAGNYDTFGPTSGVAVDGNYAYVADGTSGLQIIDITTPTAPTLAGNYDTFGFASDVAVDGNYVYVADYGNQLVILYVSDAADPGVLQFSAASDSVNEDGGSITITVTRTDGSDGVVSVDYTTSDDTATAGSDYTEASGTLNWADDDATDKTFTVDIIDDKDREADEQLIVSLGNVTGGASIGDPDTAVLTIVDNEPTITSPLPGSTLSGASETFTWTDNGTSVSRWVLFVGTRLGAIYYSGLLSGTVMSDTVSGLPTNGSTVYVWLWYRVSGRWNLIHETYTAYTDSGTPTITSPLPGSTLSGASETFTWTDNGTSVSRWVLFVGTRVGARNIYSSGLLSGTVMSDTVSGLPTNGSTVYVRLWYKVGRRWQHVDYTYTAAS